MVGLVVILGIGAIVGVRHALVLSKPFADTHTYLEIGRNLFEGRGFVTRYNVVYGWSGANTHPGLAYYNPLYCLLIAIPWQLSHSTAALAICATVLPALLNVVLLAWLVRRAWGTLPALLCAAGYVLLPTTYTNITLISAEHPMVTLELILLLLVQRWRGCGERAWLWIGVALGIGYLVKVSLLIALPALVLAVLLTCEGGATARLRTTLRAAVRLVAGMLVVLAPFNVLTKATTGKWYPEYPLLAKNWSMATLYGGGFVAASPAVRPDEAELPTPADYVDLVVENFGAMFRALISELGLLVLFVMIGLASAVWRRREDAVFLFCIGLAFLCAYPITYHWLSLTKEAGSPARYALHIAPFWYPLAVAGIAALLAKTPWRDHTRSVGLVLVWGVLAAPPAYLLLRRQATLPAANVTTETLENAMAACRAITGPDDLVAVAGGAPWIFGSMYLDRPVVALPQNQLGTAENAERFVDIYKPKLVIPGNTRAMYDVLEARGYHLSTIPGLSAKWENDPIYIRE